METLLDLNFDYPDLAETAQAMVAGTVSIEEALAKARSVLGGEIRSTVAGPARVIGPQERATKVLKYLQAYARDHNQDSAERWAAFLLMLEAQLGLGNIDAAAAPIALNTASRMMESCVNATGARCPPGAVKFALQAVDSILESPACSDPGLRARLTAAKTSFSRCSVKTGI